MYRKYKHVEETEAGNAQFNSLASNTSHKFQGPSKFKECRRLWSSLERIVQSDRSLMILIMSSGASYNNDHIDVARGCKQTKHVYCIATFRLHAGSWWQMARQNRTFIDHNSTLTGTVVRRGTAEGKTYVAGGPISTMSFSLDTFEQRKTKDVGKDTSSDNIGINNAACQLIFGDFQRA